MQNQFTNKPNHSNQYKCVHKSICVNVHMKYIHKEKDTIKNLRTDDNKYSEIATSSKED